MSNRPSPFMIASNVAATAALAMLFTMTASDACAQSPKKHKPAAAQKSYLWAAQVGKKKSPLERLTLYATVASYHTNRVTPYNEFNPGLIVGYELNTPKLNRHNMTLSAVAGGYDNSNDNLSMLGGLHLEKKWGRLGLGIIFGGVTYRENMKDDIEIPESRITYSLPAGAEAPKDHSPKRGYMLKVDHWSNVAYSETLWKLSAEGCGKNKLYPAAAPKLSFEVAENKLALNLLAVWHPKHGGLVTGAVEYHPFKRNTHRPRSFR